MNEKTNYYAIIPAPVRYDKKLIPSAKLLYGEITALSTQEGYCWATNKHFADLYKTSEKTITRWVKSLEEKGYIKSEVNTLRYADGTVKKVRKIYIDNFVPYQADKNSSNHTDKNVFDHTDKNVPYNNKGSNNKVGNIKKEKHIYGEFKNVFLKDEEYRKIEEKGLTYLIEELSSYIKSKGIKYESHYATILCWSRSKQKKEVQTTSYDIEKFNDYVENMELKYERKD